MMYFISGILLNRTLCPLVRCSGRRRTPFIWHSRLGLQPPQVGSRWVFAIETKLSG